MTKQAVIAIVVAVLIILGATGAFLYSQTRPSNEANSTTASEVTQTPENSAMRSTITEILAGGKNNMCKFSVTGETGETNGTFYTSGQNARGDFTTSVNGKETTTHMIKDGDTFYMWGDSLAMGIKMVMTVNELSSKMEGNEQFNTFNPDQEMDIDCVSWTPDATLFNPPTSVRFTSIDSMMPGTANTSTSPTSAASNQTGDSNECNICNSLTGQAKTTCLAQFNCQ